MKVIIDVPNIMFNGVAAMLTVQAPEESKNILDAMERCQETEKIELQLKGKEGKQLELAVASLALIQMYKHDDPGRD